MGEEKELIEVGRVTGFFAHPGVAIVEITADGLKVGDTIAIKGHTTDIEQKIESMQIEHEPLQEAKRGQIIGIKVKDRVRQHDIVYMVVSNKI